MDDGRPPPPLVQAPGMTPFPVRADPLPSPGEELDPWELRDPAALLDDLDRLVGLHPGRYVCLVRESSTEQLLLRVARLEGDLDLEEHDSDDSHVLHDVAGRLCEGIDTPWPIEYSFATVVVREGRCVTGTEEIAMLMAWRYANFLPRVFQGELVLVTPSGWCTFMGHDGGATPVLRVAG